jgi:cell division septation protein DedD
VAPPVVSTPAQPSIPAPSSPLPAPLPTPLPAPKPAPSPEVRFYSIQVGAFGSAANAEALVTQLKKKFDGVFVDKAASGNAPYRVRVGRLSRFTAAKELQTKLMDEGFDAYIVPPGTP